jgi:hypothetical protein
MFQKQISCKNSDWMEFEKKIDEKWFLLISNCLNPNYRKRPGISEIISYLNGDNKVINRIGNATQVMKQGLHEERERSEKNKKKISQEDNTTNKFVTYCSIKPY